MKKIIVFVLLLSMLSCAYKFKTAYGDIEFFIDAATIIGMAEVIEGRGTGDKELCLPSGVELTNDQIVEAAMIVRGGGSVLYINKNLYIGDK